MLQRDALRNLRKILAGLYPERAEGERVAEDAGLDKRYITFSDKAIQNWDGILKAALDRNRLQALVAVALDEYDGHEALAQAQQDFLNADPDPEEPEPHEAARQSATYNVHLGSASGVVIGDQGQVRQTFGAAARPPGTREPRFTYTDQDRRTDLENQLALQRQTLNLLQQQKAIYAAGEEPVKLLYQIEQKEREIAQLQDKLASLPPPQPSG